MNKKRIIVDCDTGIDDAMALTIAVSAKNLDIIAVTTVAGNTTVNNATRNTCNVLHFLGRDDIPVAMGASCPLERPLMTASSVHGKGGLRGWEFKENYSDNLSSLPAVELMADSIGKVEGKVTIVALGPVTNIEAFIRRYPGLKDRVEEIVFMGMSYHSGNPTPLSTFNVLADPEAFRKVIHSGIPFTSCPLDTTRKSFLTREDRIRIAGIDSDRARFVTSILSGYGELLPTKNECQEKDRDQMELEAINNTDVDIPLHDPTTMAYVVKPELFSGKKYYADVECKGEITMGFTFVDKEDYYKKSEEERNVFFLETVNRKGVVHLLEKALGEENE